MSEPSFPLLSLITYLPLAGVIFIWLLRGPSDAVARNARWVALWTTLVTFLLSLLTLKYYDPSTAGFQLMERHAWISSLNIQYIKGIDGISLWLVLASTLLPPLCVLCSWTAIKERVPSFMIALLLLEVFMVGMFTALDIILIFIFFEAVLLPMYFIIGIWGGQRRIYSAYKLFLYTVSGSLLMLLAMVAVYLNAGTTDLTLLLKHDFPPDFQYWIWGAFFLSFAIKSPLFPVHTWLPDAHTEAPTAGSVLLAGILLKMGGYGILRFNVELLPHASQVFAPIVFLLSVIGVIYTSLIALSQMDMKKMIAYSSVAHMAFVTLGLFSFTQQGIDGAVMQMLSHTVVSAALFLCVGVAYERMHTRDIMAYGGLANIMPHFAVLFMIFLLGSVALPGTSGFVGEFLALNGAFQANPTMAAIAAIGMVLGAAYMLRLYRHVFFGQPATQAVRQLHDLNIREWICLAPLAALVIWIGIYPGFMMEKFQLPVQQILSRYHQTASAK